MRKSTKITDLEVGDVIEYGRSRGLFIIDKIESHHNGYFTFTLKARNGRVRVEIFNSNDRVPR